MLVLQQSFIELYKNPSIHIAKHLIMTLNIFALTGINGLTKDDVVLIVPQVILQGETLNMDCKFPANESSAISSVKW